MLATDKVKLKMRRFLKAISFALVFTFFTPQNIFSAETVQINFRDADIRSVIESLAEITGKSFVLDPRVKGKVTIISPGPINSDLLYEAILSSLQVQGFQAVEDGAIIRVIPFTQAVQFAGGD